MKYFKYAIRSRYVHFIGVVFVIKIIFGFLFSILLILTFSFGRYFVYNDYAFIPIDAAANPDFHALKNASTAPHRPGVYFISYADGPEVFFKNQNALAASTLNRGADFIFNYRRSHLDAQFVADNKDILSTKQGAGLWLWKPWIIQHTLKTVPEGAIIIYCDTGFVVRKPLTPLIEAMEGRDVLLIQYDSETYGEPISITNRDLFVHMGCDDAACHRGNHLWAGFLMVRNTDTGRAFIKEWLDLCATPGMLSGNTAHNKPHPEQKTHMHDEAILSALYNMKKRDGTADHITLYNVYDFGKIALWHHRHPVREFESFTAYGAYYRVRSFERKFIFDAAWMRWLRAYLAPPKV